MRTLTIALLSLYAITGLTARLEADDYCVAALQSANGVTYENAWDYTRAMYQGWNGRVTQLFVQGLLGQFEPLNNMIVPGLMILALVLLTRQPLLIAVWLMTLPHIDGTLYWQSAAMTYLLPVIGGLSAWRLSRRSVWWAFPLALVAGGCSESMALLLIPVAIAAAVIDPTLRKAALVWCSGLVLAFIVVYAAPGNAVRAAYFPQPSMVAVQFGLIRWLMADLPLLLFHSLPGLLAAYFAGRVMPVRVTVRTVFIVWILAILVTMGMAGMVLYATSAGVPERTLALPSMLWTLALWVTGSYHARKRTHRQTVTRLLNALILLAMLHGGARLVEHGAYAAQWDARDGAIRAGHSVGLIDDRDSLVETWVQGCAAGWYGRPLTVTK